MRLYKGGHDISACQNVLVTSWNDEYKTLQANFKNECIITKYCDTWVYQYFISLSVALTCFSIHVNHINSCLPSYFLCFCDYDKRGHLGFCVVPTVGWLIFQCFQLIASVNINVFPILAAVVCSVITLYLDIVEIQGRAYGLPMQCQDNEGAQASVTLVMPWWCCRENMIRNPW